MTMTLTGVFPSREAAARAVDELILAGFPRESISVVMRGTPHAEETVHEDTADTARGAIAGMILGGTLAAIAAGALAMPAIGVIAAGPIVASIAGGGAGAAAGTALGALIGFGTGETVASEYLSRIAQGEVLIGVDTDLAHAHTASGVLRRAKAELISDSVHFGGHKHEPQHYVSGA